MRLRYTPLALVELAEILSYIAQRSPTGAKGASRHWQALSDSNRKAVSVPSNPGLRRVVASPYPSIVFYEVKESEVVIVSVRHGARAQRGGAEQA